MSPQDGLYAGWKLLDSFEQYVSGFVARGIGGIHGPDHHGTYCVTDRNEIQETYYFACSLDIQTLIAERRGQQTP
jgi:hypothetical protein